MTVSSHVSRALPHALLAGGRMTKWKGRVASLSPQGADLRGSVSVAALASALALAGGVMLAPGLVVAGSCSGSAGTYTCTGAANSGSDTMQTLTSANLQVTTSAGFGITTTSGTAIVLTGTSGVTFTDANSSAITGAGNGMYAGMSTGSGAVSVTTTGVVTGGTGSGLNILNNSSTGTNLTASMADVTGTDGIFAINRGVGATSITTTGTVTGTQSVSSAGIRAFSYGTSLTIAAYTVTSANYGIYGKNNGTGALSITTTGAVTGAGINGIRAANYGTDLTINAADVAGGYYGIYAQQRGTGTLAVTVSGTVTGGAGVSSGISTVTTTAGGSVTIDLLSTASVSATSGYAIKDGTGNATVTVSGATVTGSISLGYGSDTLTISTGTDLSGVTSMIGGSDSSTDTLNLKTDFAGSSLTSWEVINLDATAADFTVGSVIAGSGALNVAGTGTVTLSGTNTLTGATTISGGTLSLTGTLENSAIAVASGATLSAASGTLAGVISGAGGLVKTGSGTLTLSGTNTLTGATTISGGTLSLTGTLENSAIAIASGATLSAASGTLGGVISGAGDLVKTGSGTLTLSGTNTLTGATTISGGTLSLTGTLENSAIAIASGATLSAASGTLGGVISGAGELMKSGSGTLTLSGTNTLSGATTVSDGELAITGSLNSSAVTVASGSTLSGTGSIGSLVAQSGSTIYAGTRSTYSGVLTITGNATLAAGSTLTIGVFGTGSREYSQLSIGGSASLAGDLDIDVTDGNTGATALAEGVTISNVLVTTGGITGSFASVTDNSVLFDFTAVTNGNAVDLAITGSSTTASETSVMRPAEGAAGVIDTLIADGTSGDMQTVVNAFGGLTTETAVANAVYQTLPSLSGGTANVTKPGSAASNQARSRGGKSRSRSNAGLGLANGEAWLSPLGGWAHQSQLDDATGFDARFYGMIGGADAEVAPGLRLGLAFAYIQTRIDSTSDIVENSLTVDSYEASAYGTWEVTETVSLLGDLSLGRNEYDGTRHMSFATLNRTAEASYGGYGFTASTSVEKRFRLAEALTFTPSVGLHYQASWDEGYAETGANALNLQVDGQRTHSLSSGLDGQIDYTLANGVELSAKGGVAYDLINDRSRLTVAYQGAAANSFQVDGPMGSPWTGHAGVGVLAKLDSGVDVSAAYTLGAGDGLSSHTAGLRAKWAF